MQRPPPARHVRPSRPRPRATRFLDTLVLLPVLTWYILDATQVAVVVLIIIVTLLRQHDPKQGQRAALGLILGNLIGGIAAAIVYNLVLLSNTLLFFITVCLAASLIFAGRIVTAGDRAPIYAIAFATFILLLGPRHDAPAGRERRGFREPLALCPSCLGLRDRRPVARAALARRLIMSMSVGSKRGGGHHVDMATGGFFLRRPPLVIFSLDMPVGATNKTMFENMARKRCIHNLLR